MSWARPNAIADNILKVDAQELFLQGKRALLLDLDNTLAMWKSHEVAKDVERWILSAKAAGFKIAIVSNNHEKRIRPVAHRLGVLFVERAAKPLRRGFEKAMRLLEIEAQEGVAIGDQLVTDIIGANRCGLYTIWVKPLDSSQESIGTKLFNRVFERMFIRRLGLK
jgi:HAD superfamily phosphatase (TIGR01668 family)